MDEIKLNLENLTTEEREQLMKLVEKGNKKPVEKQKVWKPELGDTYYFTWSDGEIDSHKWEGNVGDNFRWMVGSVYKTEEDLKFAIEKRETEMMLQRYADENNEDGFDILDEDTEKIHIEYCLDNSRLDFDSYGSYLFGNVVYFSSEDIANKAIESVGEDRIKKYIFGVK